MGKIKQTINIWVLDIHMRNIAKPTNEMFCFVSRQRNSDYNFGNFIAV